jgi:dTDP-4-dehydrorhamnose 3,5-epimerase
METYRKEEFDKHIGNINFVQDNDACSMYGVLRGLHYQAGETAQAKLVRVLDGRVLDVAVDIRKDSPTFGQYKAVELTGNNRRQLFIPRGFAHGYVVTSAMALLTYKVDNAYSPSTEQTLDCFDPDLNIDWGLKSELLLLSDKDKLGKSLKEIKTNNS